MGAGGVGKTSISLLLADKKDEIPFEYDSSISLEGEQFGKSTLIVAPGQETRADNYWMAIQKDLNDGKIKGLINVVAYGYHAIETSSLSDLSFYTSEMTNEDFILQYVASKKQQEIDLLKQLANSLRGFKKEIWMLTIVNKQDLWWDDRNEVMEFYTKGVYNDTIQELSSKIGANNFTHEYVSMSPIINNFRVNQHVIKPNSTGYDQLLQKLNESKVLEILDRSIK